MKKFLFVAVIASSMLACNKQEITPPEQATGKSSVKLSIQQAVPSKGVSNEKGNTEYAVIGSGKLYFIDGSNNSIYQRELTASEIDSITNTPSTPGGHSIVITGIPNTAVKLYFMANIKTSAGTTYPMVDGTTSADARLRIDKLQADAIHVPMSGLSGNFVQTTGSQYTASVTLTPIVARIELGQVTVENQNGAGQAAVTADIKNYKLSGVFINNTRQDVLLNGTPYLVGAPIDIKSQTGWASSWATYFTSANTNFPYYNGGSPAGPSDWKANALVTHCQPGASARSFYPDSLNGSTDIVPTSGTKKVWGYQVCPSTVVAPGVPADVPHLILKLTDVTYYDNPLGQETKYVTVTKYKDSSNNPITAFERGNVYRIENLRFSHNEATNQPYEKNISVTATVSVAPWIINTIDPDWN